ncbi:MAG TPA: hypothetical protein VNA69_10865 [Thermoanaerobaculia bacterium]|nr:hypothetical protein [Thermoanaerobaculia bacterium]
MFRISRSARADVAPDGRFLVVGAEDPKIPPLTLVTGWAATRE